MLDKKQIQVIFLFEFKTGHKAADVRQHVFQDWVTNCDVASSWHSLIYKFYFIMTRTLNMRSTLLIKA